MIFIYRFVLGCLKVSFSGEFPERILNLCADSGITLWGSKSVNNCLTAFITVRDFYLIPGIVRGTKIKVHIEEKYGFPFILERYNKRWGIPVGVIIFLCFLEVMSSFIWVIDIKGNKNIKSTEILNSLADIGIYEGVLSSRISPKNDSQRLLLKMDSLAWASLNIEGSRLTVNITETEEKKKKDNRPCNLKAEFDGVIKKIDLKSGNSVVKVGDTVKKGDALVSGIIENAGGTRFVHSVGEIVAEVTHTFTLSEDFKKETVTENGSITKRRVLEFFTLKIPLFLGNETKECNTSVYCKNLNIFGTKLPLRIHTKEYRYTENMTLNRSEEKLKEELESKMKKLLTDKKISDYKVKSKDFKGTKKGITLKLTVTAQQNIAYKDFLIISTGNQ